MSNVLSSLWRLITAILKKIFKWIADLLGDWLLIILIIVLIFFAPEIAIWLTSVGAPTFLVTAFETLALATPYVVSALTWIWEGGSAIIGAAWDAYKGLGIGTQAAILLGAAALIAPEETAAFASDAASLVATGVGVIASAITGNPVLLLLAVGAAWWFFFRDKDDGPTPEQLAEMQRRQTQLEAQDQEDLDGEAYVLEGQ